MNKGIAWQQGDYLCFLMPVSFHEDDYTAKDGSSINANDVLYGQTMVWAKKRYFTHCLGTGDLQADRDARMPSGFLCHATLVEPYDTIVASR